MDMHAKNIPSINISNSSIDAVYSSIDEYLLEEKIDFQTFDIDDIEQGPKNPALIISKLFSNESGSHLQVIYSAASMLDFNYLCISHGEDLEIINNMSLYDSVLSSACGLSKIYGVTTILDSGLKELIESTGYAYLTVGIPGKVLKLDYRDFYRIQEPFEILDFTYPITKLCNTKLAKISDIQKDIKNVFIPIRMKQRIYSTIELPAMPKMGMALLNLRSKEDPDILELAEIIELDPSLSAQLISWACSPYYGYAGKVLSVKDAIINVLGYNLVMNLAIGICLSNAIKIANEGPFGLKSYWSHALSNATLTRELLLKSKLEVNPDLGYLCGLLHNFGILLLGQLFPRHHYMLSNMVLLNNDLPLTKIENYLFNLDHQLMGQWLMEAWHMPEDIIEVVAHHHAYFADAQCSAYTWSVQLSNQLIAKYGWCDEVYIPEKLTNLYQKLEIADEDFAKIEQAYTENKDSLSGILPGS